MIRILFSCLLLANAYSKSLTDTVESRFDSAVTISEDTSIVIDLAAQRYVQKCLGCHTIGGGRLTGPDLLPTRAWPKSELAAKVKLMEPRVGPLTDDEVSDYVSLLQDARADARVKIAQELASKAVAATLEPASQSVGRELFDGTQPLANGGLACITCHRAGASGGTLGPDLTAVSTRMGKIAMTSAIQQSQFKVMSGAYANSPITAQEAVHLAEYLSFPDKMPQSSAENSVSLVGTLIGAIGLFIVVTLYRKRERAISHRFRGAQ
ncbi:hypothetical protein HUU59_08585 [bacterium]|nr:hypothetical protein [bacterium]